MGNICVDTWKLDQLWAAIQEVEILRGVEIHPVQSKFHPINK